MSYFQTLKNIAGTLINPATWDAQTNGSQLNQLVSSNLINMSDNDDNCLIQLENEHRKVHQGGLFQVNVYSTVTFGTPVYCQMKTGAKTVHLKQKTIDTDSADQILCTFIEAPTLTDGTTVVPIINRNRNSANTSDITIYSDPTGISGGTIIDYNFIDGGGTGSHTKTGTPAGTTIEWNLKPNTTYLHKLEGLNSGTVKFLAKLLFYEI